MLSCSWHFSSLSVSMHFERGKERKRERERMKEQMQFLIARSADKERETRDGKGENAKRLFCLFAYKLAVKLSFFFSFSLEWLCSFFLLLLTEWAAGRTQKEKLFLSSFDLPALPLNSWLIHAFGNACLLWTGGGLKAAAAGSIEGVSTWPQQQQQGCTCTRTLNAAAALMFGRFTDVEGKKKTSSYLSI